MGPWEGAVIDDREDASTSRSDHAGPSTAADCRGWRPAEVHEGVRKGDEAHLRVVVAATEHVDRDDQLARTDRLEDAQQALRLEEEVTSEKHEYDLTAHKPVQLLVVGGAVDAALQLRDRDRMLCLVRHCSLEHPSLRAREVDYPMSRRCL